MQGIAEFLPISSSAHLIVVSWFLKGKESSLAFDVALHLGTFLALVVYFHKDLFKLTIKILEKLRGKASYESDHLFPFLVIGTIPAAVIGFFLQKIIETTLHHPVVTIVPLALVGWLLWWGDKKLPVTTNLDSLSLKKALVIGLMQSLSLIPGVSRSGITMLGARMTGLNRVEASRISFLLAIPVTLGAILVKFKEIMAALLIFENFVGFVAAFIAGILSIHGLLIFLRKGDFFVFGVYRTLLALAILSKILFF